MWKISKDFYADYGHRVWSQHLKEEYCAVGDTACKCRHLHGHTGKITIALSGGTLERGMVTDFKHLGVIGDFIDNYLDHKMIIDRNDPNFTRITHFNTNMLLTPVFIDRQVFGHIIKPQQGLFIDATEAEIVDGFFVVDFVPTSENLAKFIFNVTKWKLRDLATVDSVSWQETPKSIATYYGED